MKNTIVPAQITTVEDHVAGSLGFSQLILLAIPVFGGSLLFAILPPTMGASLYKLVLIGVIAATCSLLAIRIRGKILLLWLIVLLRYRLRPKLYLFNKNTEYFRAKYLGHPLTSRPEISVKTRDSRVALPGLDWNDSALAYATLSDPARHLRYETTKKGGLYVRYTDIED